MQINLVIDDSGSMFYDGRVPLDRWSFAKYSLQVFAALMRPSDSLNVYRLSDFAGAGSRLPELRMVGTESVQDRTTAIQDMQFIGKRTPYAAVEQGYKDLQDLSTKEKWLVVITDGKFQDTNKDLISSEQIQKDLQTFVKQSRDKGNKLNVAFLALGNEAPGIEADPENGIFFARAATAPDLLGQLTGFSNKIFGRAIKELDSSGTWTPDIDMEEILLFAQGENVKVGAAETMTGSIDPTSVVKVNWTSNQNITYSGKIITPTPNRSLQGQIATFENIPRGQVTFDVSNSANVSLFYKPRVNFGITLLDEAGTQVQADKIIDGKYTVDFGFMEKNCEIINSDLLGDVDYSATITQDGQQRDFTAGEQIDLKRGDVILDVAASFLNGSSTSAVIDLKVLQAAMPSKIQAGDASFLVSEMGEFPALSEGIPLRYFIEQKNGVDRPPTPEEWAGLDLDSLEYISESNLEFKAVPTDVVGDFLVLVRAPEGDVYAADTGGLKVTVTASRTFDEQESVTEATLAIKVIDDLSFMDRLSHWFKTDGWKWLIALLLLILLLGYLFKKRFSKTLVGSPVINCSSPGNFGTQKYQEDGEFSKNKFIRILPFIADRAELTYVPRDAYGFEPMRLKAIGSKQMIPLNWKEVVQQEGDTEVDGTKFDEEMTDAPPFRESAEITSFSGGKRYATRLNTEQSL